MKRERERNRMQRNGMLLHIVVRVLLIDMKAGDITYGIGSIFDRIDFLGWRKATKSSIQSSNYIVWQLVRSAMALWFWHFYRNLVLH